MTLWIDGIIASWIICSIIAWIAIPPNTSKQLTILLVASSPLGFAFAALNSMRNWIHRKNPEIVQSKINELLKSESSEQKNEKPEFIWRPITKFSHDCDDTWCHERPIWELVTDQGKIAKVTCNKHKKM